MYIKSLQELIIKETSDYIFLNKPPFLTTLDDRVDSVTILSLVKTVDENYQLCHRIDKETSGVLLVAKNPEAYRNASIQFEKRAVKKVYHCLVDGIHEFSNHQTNLPLHVTSSGYVKVSHKRGKEAQTTFNTLEAFKIHTMVEAKPLSGRMHQIRVHLASEGASIAGDEKYGGKPFLLSSFKKKYNAKKEVEEQPIIKRVALHAYKLELKDLEGSLISAEANYPKDFEVALKQLRKNKH